ncbi:CAP domain-containing protein [Tannerella sp.]|uniref:CAP domain-containing protein n=1 Tax=Tannerella sp. TaxID=2382127 RepID=UPI0026DD5992|nr:CAP domain-containing protein [Tannerella sp.]
MMKKIILLFLCGWIMLLTGCAKESPVDDDEEHPSVSLTEYEKKVVALVNKERKAAGLKTLKIETSLMVDSDVRAKEIVSEFSHTRPDGNSCFTVITTKFASAGENIAKGYASPENVMKGWMNSKGHKENIMNGQFTHIGVGCHREKGTFYWVQLFIEK